MRVGSIAKILNVNSNLKHHSLIEKLHASVLQTLLSDTQVLLLKTNDYTMQSLHLAGSEYLYTLIMTYHPSKLMN